MNYLINEYFHSMQGEGYFTGMPSCFIRMQGCDVGCNFCDTKYTWSFKTKEVPHSELKSDSPQHASMRVDELLYIADESPHIVITGGEPCLQDLTPLTTDFIRDGKSVQIETSATVQIKAHKDTWITLSPKFYNPGKKPILKSCVERANEFKFPVAQISDLLIIDEFFEQWDRDDRLVWLQPISQGKEATEVCLEEARKRGWRISVQTHKYLGLR